MSVALTIFLASTLAFVGYAVFVSRERALGKRLILGTVRDRLDQSLLVISHGLHIHWQHLSRYVFKLGWYYSVHRVLRTILGSLVFIYTFFEAMFERNRERTKELRKELRRQLHKKTHLTQMAEHKADSALSPEEQAALKAKKLEQDH